MFPKILCLYFPLPPHSRKLSSLFLTFLTFLLCFLSSLFFYPPPPLIPSAFASLPPEPSLFLFLLHLLPSPLLPSSSFLYHPLSYSSLPPISIKCSLSINFNVPLLFYFPVSSLLVLSVLSSTLFFFSPMSSLIHISLPYLFHLFLKISFFIFSFSNLTHVLFFSSIFLYSLYLFHSHLLISNLSIFPLFFSLYSLSSH